MRFLNPGNGTSPEKILNVVRNALTTTIAVNVPVYAITSTPNGVTTPDGTFVTDVNNGNQLMGYTLREIPASSAPTEILAWGYHDGLATFTSVFGSGGGTAGSLQLTTATEPTANLSNQGKIILVAGGVGIADSLRICIKDETDTYLWVSLI